LPTDLIRAVSMAAHAGCWLMVGKCKFFAANIDCAAPSHVDVDFLFSVFQINVLGAEFLVNDAAVAQHFCCPEHGYAIAVHPGDAIICNPNFYHCISSKTDAYEGIPVHVTIFYLKSTHAGGGDNRRQLAEEELKHYDMHLSVPK